MALATGMVENRNEDRNPVIRAFVALSGETLVGVSRKGPSWWRDLCYSSTGIYPVTTDAMIKKILNVLKSGGATGLLIIAFLVLLALPALFLFGTIYVYTKYLADILSFVDGIAFCLAFVFLFLCIFRPCRIFSGTALVLCSYAIGIDLWFQSLVNTYVSFGIGGTVIGVVLFGIGAYFTGLAALLWAHLYGAFFSFVFYGVFALGMNILGSYIAQKEAERRYDPELDEPDADGITGRMLERMISQSTKE